jgi:hypothetical protein
VGLGCPHRITIQRRAFGYLLGIANAPTMETVIPIVEYAHQGFSLDVTSDNTGCKIIIDI